MASVENLTRPPAQEAALARDDLDDLFDYDVDDVFGALESPKAQPSKEVSKNSQNGAGLGIDEEVEVSRKQRIPRVKLDETRLLSQAGIPTLRKRARVLKFKGKGHEYSDAARLLQFYQLWLDDLFPKARFLDALSMVEKLGHKRSMQIMRNAWINEGKPRDSVHETSIFDDPVLPPREPSDRDRAPIRVAPIFENRDKERHITPPAIEEPEEDLYGATPRATRTTGVGPGQQNGSIFGAGKTVVPAELEDDLDMLLAEQEMLDAAASTGLTQTAAKATLEPDFDDEMEAMAEMGTVDQMGSWE